VVACAQGRGFRPIDGGICLTPPPCFPDSALVWGSSVKHNPQNVGREHILNDEDVVQLVKKV